MIDEDLLIHKLTHSSQEAVYAWLEGNAKVEYPEYCKLENALLSLNSPLITLGLALFGKDADVAHKIYQKNDVTLKKAVLSGVSIEGKWREGWVEKSGLLTELVQNRDKELLSVFLKNQKIHIFTILNFLKQEKQFCNLEHEFYFALLNEAFRNNIFPKWYSKESIMCIVDPLGGWIHDSNACDFFEKDIIKISKACWSLFETLPTTSSTACWLSLVAENLIPKCPDGLNPEKTAQRWISTDAANAKDPFGGDYFENCRTLLGTLFEGDELKNHPDLALRKSYYRKFQFESPEDLKPLLARDGDAFIEAASTNLWLYRNCDFREQLSECIKSSSREYGKFSEYKDRFEAISKAIPHWFLDEEGSGVVSVDHITDPVLKQNYIFKHLLKKIESLSVAHKKNYEVSSENIQQIRQSITHLSSRIEWIFWAALGTGMWLLFRAG
jgi:hypothetical protein